MKRASLPSKSVKLSVFGPIKWYFK